MTVYLTLKDKVSSNLVYQDVNPLSEFYQHPLEGIEDWIKKRGNPRGLK